MKLNYKFKITKTYNYCGYPQNKRKYIVEAQFFTLYLTYYGNQGWEMPEVERKRQCNGFYWSFNGFMRDFYNYEFDKYFKSLHTDESVEFTREY